MLLQPKFLQIRTKKCFSFELAFTNFNQNVCRLKNKSQKHYEDCNKTDDNL